MTWVVCASYLGSKCGTEIRATEWVQMIFEVIAEEFGGVMLC